MPANSLGDTDNPEESLYRYRESLTSFRLEFGGSREMPDVNFFLFGMSMIDEKYVAAENSSTHTWPASEVFLYLLKSQ